MPKPKKTPGRIVRRQKRLKRRARRQAKELMAAMDQAVNADAPRLLYWNSKMQTWS